MAGLALASGDAGAMPQRLWIGATHFALECRLQGLSPREAAAFCARLAPVAKNTLNLAYRPISGPDDVILSLDLRPEGKRLAGTLVAIRRALRGETDERSRPVPVDLAMSEPEKGFVAAIGLMRNPMRRPGLSRIRPAA